MPKSGFRLIFQPIQSDSSRIYCIGIPVYVFIPAFVTPERNSVFFLEYKRNFLRVKQVVAIGGPDDGVITPWQSSQFGFYDKNETVLPYTEQVVRQCSLCSFFETNFCISLTVIVILFVIFAYSHSALPRTCSKKSEL